MKKLPAEGVSRYKAELAKLPIGSISRKKIAGKTRYESSSIEARTSTIQMTLAIGMSSII